RLQRQMADLRGELDVVISSIPRARNAIIEAEIRLSGAKLNLQAEARERLGKAVGELAIVEESIKAALDRVERTSLRSPVSGIVNQLHVNTIGAVVRPGQDLVEIVPIDDTLLIEARIQPQDVAFVRPGQEASVKLSAYDYSIYGALQGKVERVSADTFTEGRENTFYRVIVRTDRSYLEGPDGKLPILPGMIAQIDILTGEKTVLSYLINPINKVRHEALRER
ncbi:MAG: HlyD family type I secretion periplasmic adaptor subunit, partial [Fimbriimonadaceae bacterium]|nr:HlyD family type I secretion periplasmic adaptor subunit [Alphaproteobacteria bacterium]